jgi:hypothetical protein
MSEPTAGGVVLVVCGPDDPAAARVRAYLEHNGLQAATWFTPRDLDDVDRRIQAGGVGRVLISNEGDLLGAIWDGRVDLEAWRRTSARIAFLEEPDGSVPAWLETVSASWRTWRRRRSRQQVVACLVLSIVALLAACGLLFICR